MARRTPWGTSDAPLPSRQGKQMSAQLCLWSGT